MNVTNIERHHIHVKKRKIIHKISKKNFAKTKNDESTNCKINSIAYQKKCVVLLDLDALTLKGIISINTYFFMSLDAHTVKDLHQLVPY